MIWIILIGFSLVAFVPIWRPLGQRRFVGTREASLAFYQQQLHELNADGFGVGLSDTDRHCAKLEIERRALLAIKRLDDGQGSESCKVIAVVACAVVVVAAIALYSTYGSPRLPAAPLASRSAAELETSREDLAILDLLRARISALDPSSPQAIQGKLLLHRLQEHMIKDSGALSVQP